MLEVEGEIKKWGNSVGLRLSKRDFRKSNLKLNQRIKAIVISKSDTIGDTFGIFKELRKKSGQQMKDEIRKDLHGM